MMSDDDEPITFEWWTKQPNVSNFGFLEICSYVDVWMDHTGIGIHMYEDQDCMSLDLPAVRTRGDVRTLVRLLGSE